MGFSHNHLSGTGWADLGDILVMPTVGQVKMVPDQKISLKQDTVQHSLMIKKLQHRDIIP